MQSAQQSVQKAKATQNEKLKGVYAVKAAEDAVIAAQNAQKVADTLSNLGNTLSENTAAAENPMSALSLLGNKNESERSTTRAAIGENIAITLTQDPNAETTLNHLNRDAQNANQKVTKHDISEVKETQELVKGIGEIADKAR